MATFASFLLPESRMPLAIHLSLSDSLMRRLCNTCNRELIIKLVASPTLSSDLRFIILSRSTFASQHLSAKLFRVLKKQNGTWLLPQVSRQPRHDEAEPSLISTSFCIQTPPFSSPVHIPLGNKCLASSFASEPSVRLVLENQLKFIGALR